MVKYLTCIYNAIWTCGFSHTCICYVHILCVQRWCKIRQPQTHTHISDGPFYISCNSEQLFLKVVDNKVMVTDDISKADEFFVVPCEDEGSLRNHFSIFYNSQSKLKMKTQPPIRIKPIPRYLCTSVNFRGISNDPLELKLNAKESKSLLTLQDRRSRHLYPVELTDWINGKEIFYINCKHRAFKSDSYIAVTATAAGGERGRTIARGDLLEGEEADLTDNAVISSGKVSGGGLSDGSKRHYTTCCRPSVASHDDHGTFMLFRLIRVRQRDDDWEKYDEQDHERCTAEHGGKKGASDMPHNGGGGKRKDKHHSTREE